MSVSGTAQEKTFKVHNEGTRSHATVLMCYDWLFPAWNQHIEHPVVQGERQLAADADAADRGPPGLQGCWGARGRQPVDGWEGLSQVRISYLNIFCVSCGHGLW